MITLGTLLLTMFHVCTLSEFSWLSYVWCYQITCKQSKYINNWRRKKKQLLKTKIKCISNQIQSKYQVHEPIDKVSDFNTRDLRSNPNTRLLDYVLCTQDGRTCTWAGMPWWNHLTPMNQYILKRSNYCSREDRNSEGSWERDRPPLKCSPWEYHLYYASGSQ